MIVLKRVQVRRPSLSPVTHMLFCIISHILLEILQDCMWVTGDRLSLCAETCEGCLNTLMHDNDAFERMQAMFLQATAALIDRKTNAIKVLA